jgi:hypothetical protein
MITVNKKKSNNELANEVCEVLTNNYHVSEEAVYSPFIVAGLINDLDITHAQKVDALTVAAYTLQGLRTPRECYNCSPYAFAAFVILSRGNIKDAINEQEAKRSRLREAARDAKRVNNDYYGNPRYVMDLDLFLTTKERDELDYQERRPVALERARKVGGRAYRGKDFGGGVVFTSYNLSDEIATIFEGGE